MQNLKLVLLPLMVILGWNINAQSNDILSELAVPSDKGGVVIMEADTLLEGLIALQQEVNIKSGVDGFKVKLYRGSNVKTAREEALKVKATVLEKFPDAVVDVEYVQPVWFVKMGSFINYRDAVKLKNELEIALPALKNDISIMPAKIKAY